LAQNYNVASDFQSIMAFVAVIVVTAGVVWINRIAFILIDKLGEL